MKDWCWLKSTTHGMQELMISQLPEGALLMNNYWCVLMVPPTLLALQAFWKHYLMTLWCMQILYSLRIVMDDNERDAALSLFLGVHDLVWVEFGKIYITDTSMRIFSFSIHWTVFEYFEETLLWKIKIEKEVAVMVACYCCPSFSCSRILFLRCHKQVHPDEMHPRTRRSLRSVGRSIAAREVHEPE